GSGRVPDARCRSRVRRDSVQELSRRGPEPRRAERAARVPARWNCRPQIPEQVPGRHRSRAQPAAPETGFLTRAYWKWLMAEWLMVFPISHYPSAIGHGFLL